MTYIPNGLGVLGDLIGSIYIWNVCHLKITKIMHNNSFRTKYGNDGLLNKK